jgi:TolB protein
MRRFLACLAALLLAAPAFAQVGATAAATAAKPLKLDLDAADFKPVLLAAPFTAETPAEKEVAKNIRDVAAKDLADAGLVTLTDPATLTEKDADITLTPAYPAWRANGVQALLQLRVIVRADGMLNVQFRIYDIALGQQMYATQYAVQSNTLWRRLAHKIADNVYEQLTGKPGYFDSRIVFASMPKDYDGRTLTVMDQDGANVERLAPASKFIDYPRFSPSGQSIAFSSVDLPTSIDDGRTTTMLYDLLTGRRETIAQGAGRVPAVRFSKDGRKLVYSRFEENGSRLYTFEFAKRTEARLTQSAAKEWAPSLSPDGSLIVFVSNRHSAGDLYIGAANGGDVPCARPLEDKACPITTGGEYANPVWSPTDNLIAFEKIAGQRLDRRIGVMRPDGSGEQLLTKDQWDQYPAFSSNGRVLVFSRAATPAAPPKLMTIERSGRNLRDLPTPGLATQPDWGPLNQ